MDYLIDPNYINNTVLYFPNNSDLFQVECIVKMNLIDYLEFDGLYV